MALSAERNEIQPPDATYLSQKAAYRNFVAAGCFFLYDTGKEEKGFPGSSPASGSDRVMQGQ